MIRAATAASGILLAVVVLAGCAAIPLAGFGGAALESGAGAVVKTCTEYTAGGTAHRTFTIPQNAVRAAVLEAFNRTGVVVKEQEQKDENERLTGELHKRTVRVRLTPLSPSLTAKIARQPASYWSRSSRCCRRTRASRACYAAHPPTARRPVRAERAVSSAPTLQSILGTPAPRDAHHVTPRRTRE